MQGLLLVILACLDNSLWLDCVVNSAAAMEAVFEVLVSEFGFEADVEVEEAVQGQEAAWAILAAISGCMLTSGITPQVGLDHSSVFSSNEAHISCRHLIVDLTCFMTGHAEHAESN